MVVNESDLLWGKVRYGTLPGYSFGPLSTKVRKYLQIKRVERGSQREKAEKERKSNREREKERERRNRKLIKTLKLKLQSKN